MENIRQTISIVDGENVRRIVVGDGGQTASEDIAGNKAINVIVPPERATRLLIRAVNNWTRERNYFRLYNQLVEKEISEEEFDREIKANEDDYVVCNNEGADMDDIRAALSLCPYLKDVKDVDNMADLFLSAMSRSVKVSGGDGII